MILNVPSNPNQCLILWLGFNVLANNTTNYVDLNSDCCMSVFIWSFTTDYLNNLCPDSTEYEATQGKMKLVEENFCFANIASKEVQYFYTGSIYKMILFKILR